MCACVCSVVCDSVTPWTVACQVPLSMEFPRQECWNGWTFPLPGYLPDPGIKLESPTLAGGVFTWESQNYNIVLFTNSEKLEAKFFFVNIIDNNIKKHVKLRYKSNRLHARLVH